jgi:futalosine hydrolase
MILVVVATLQEVTFLESRLSVELLVTGIGPVEAAARVALALARQRYDLVINAGIAGTYEGEGRIGEAVVVAEDRFEIDRETGTPLELPDSIDIADRVRSDPAIVDRMEARGFRAVRGITVSRVTETDATAERLRARGGQVESMEGFAVLRAAELAGVRAVEVRGISNYAGARASASWDFAAGRRGVARIANDLLSIESVPS